MSINKTAKTGIIIIIILLAVIGFLLFKNFDFGFGGKTSITTQGQSELTTDPDFVSVYFLVETLDDSAQIAKDKNAEISEKVLNELSNIRISKEDIETINYNIYESYRWDGEKQVKEGFKVSNNLKVKIEDNELVGKTIDVIIDNKALVQSINSEISKETENKLKKNALAKAAQDAREKAEALAEGSGGRLGRLKEISTEEFYYQPYPIYARAEGVSMDVGEVRKAATDIQPRKLTVTGNVRAVYEIR